MACWADERGLLDCAGAVAALCAWQAQKPAAVRRVSVEEFVFELNSHRHCVPALVRCPASDLGIGWATAVCGPPPPAPWAGADGLAEVVGYGREVRSATQHGLSGSAQQWGTRVFCCHQCR